MWWALYTGGLIFGGGLIVGGLRYGPYCPLVKNPAYDPADKH